MNIDKFIVTSLATAMLIMLTGALFKPSLLENKGYYGITNLITGGLLATLKSGSK
jgi:hypothetical protein